MYLARAVTFFKRCEGEAQKIFKGSGLNFYIFSPPHS